MTAKSEDCSEILQSQYWFDNGDAQIEKKEQFERRYTDRNKA
jgi:hypothetical protein